MKVSWDFKEIFAILKVPSTPVECKEGWQSLHMRGVALSSHLWAINYYVIKDLGIILVYRIEQTSLLYPVNKCWVSILERRSHCREKVFFVDPHKNSWIPVGTLCSPFAKKTLPNEHFLDFLYSNIIYASQAWWTDLNFAYFNLYRRPHPSLIFLKVGKWHFQCSCWDTCYFQKDSR